MKYSFADCVLDSDRLTLERNGRNVPLEPQVYRILAHLVTYRGRVVSKTELLDDVWGDRFVSVAALSSRVSSARRAVGDDGYRQAVIRTAHGIGFEFVADVTEIMEPAGSDIGPDGVDPANIGAGDVDALLLHYEMEMAAHRDTVQQLLDEKDRTIAAQQALIERLVATPV